MTSRTYRMAADSAQAELDKFAAELAASIAEQQAAELTKAHTNRITALVSTAGVQAAGITLRPTATPARRLTRQELVLSAARGQVAALADDIAAAIETGTPVTPEPTATPEPQPVGFWANYRAGRRFAKAYRDAYVEALR